MKTESNTLSILGNTATPEGHSVNRVPLITSARILESNRRSYAKRLKKKPGYEVKRKLAWRKNNPEKQKALNQKSGARHRCKLADGYVRRLLATGTGRKRGDFTQDAVDLKRMQIQLQRMFKRGGKLSEALQ